jgi:hypothetical protein
MKSSVAAASVVDTGGSTSDYTSPVSPNSLPLLESQAATHAVGEPTALAAAVPVEQQEAAAEGSALFGSARVLYGIATCSAPGFPPIVDAIFDTWGKKLPRQQLVLAGGLRDDNIEGLVQEATPCGDKAKDFWCKEAVTIWRAAQRAKAMNAGWLCVSQEDKYIWVDEVDAALKDLDSSKPMVYAHYGCAQHWEHNVKSKENTVPAPKGWRKNIDYCDAVHKFGSICGGPTYFMSRGMMDGLVKGIDTLSEFLQAFRGASANKTNTRASDVLSTCFFYDRLPDAKWRMTRADKPWLGIPGSEGIMRTASAKKFLKDGRADPETFMDKWRTSKHTNKPPLTMHLNQKSKQEVPIYMKQMHAAAEAAAEAAKAAGASPKVAEKGAAKAAVEAKADGVASKKTFKGLQKDDAKAQAKAAVKAMLLAYHLELFG